MRNPLTPEQIEKRREYDKVYWFRNREKRLLQNKIWRAENKERYDAMNLQYRQARRVELAKKSREYHKENKDRIKLRMKAYYQSNKDKEKNRQAACRAKWMEYIKSVGMDVCSRCGYSKCFAAIDFHHRNPAEKKIGVGLLLVKKMTPERVEELHKCVALCANCHREVHHFKEAH